jgi:hypothetical protein
LFGYIKPYREELRVRELELFKAYYCGLCRVLGRVLPLWSRLCLNYDMVFLYLLLASLEAGQEDVSMGRCPLHPTARRPFALAGEGAAYTAYISAMLTWMKLLDDQRDEGSWKARLAAPLFHGPAQKALRVHPLYWKKITDHLLDLARLEEEKCGRMDQAADPFACLTGQICAAPFVQDPENQAALYWTGYHVGRWIYLLDAFDDLEKDLKKNCYNPLFSQFHDLYQGSAPDFVRAIRPVMEERLFFTLDSAAKSYELLKVLKNKDLLDNIIYLGMPRRTQEVLDRRQRHEKPL